MYRCRSHMMLMFTAIAALLPVVSQFGGAQDRKPGQNSLFTDVFTEDPVPFVYKDTVHLYTGHDEAKRKEMATMKDWLVFSTKDMRNWTAHTIMLH